MKSCRTNDHQCFAVIDYELYSECDLKKAGAYEYAIHPSTEILCVAWCVGTRKELERGDYEVKLWAPALGNDDPRNNFAEFYQLFFDDNLMFVAHNAFFEQMITRHNFARVHMYSKRKEILARTEPERWICTAAQAATLALPRSLELAGKVLQLEHKKDMVGSRLLKKWMKPRKPSKYNPSTRHTDPSEFEKILAYCQSDIKAEVEVFLKTPMLKGFERKLWCLDQKINARGFSVDRPFVETAIRLINEERAHLDRETVGLTAGFVNSATNRNDVLLFLKSEGYFLPDLQKETVDTAIKEGLVAGDSLRLLKIRQKASLTSLAKYPVLWIRSGEEGRCRDNLVFHTASTGRWGGVGFQPQNLPRALRWLRDTISARETIMEGDLEWLRTVYGDPLAVISACIRNAIIAAPGHTLHIADYNAIEVRVLFWLAKHKAGVQALKEGRDLYKALAAKVFRVAIDDIGKDSFERFVGKEGVLGAGYGMGWARFQVGCDDKGQPISSDLAKKTIASYREEHKPVVDLWHEVERAAIAAVQNPGKEFYCSRDIPWCLEDDGFLYCTLPSGRRLAYKDPSVEYKPTPWGDNKPVLHHYGVDKNPRLWTKQKTWGGTLVENLSQAVARDIMASAMMRVEERGPWKIILTVHDELLAEKPLRAKETELDFVRVLEELPDWAKGCPIKAEGFASERYRK